jgi:hypothetical protein
MSGRPIGLSGIGRLFEAIGRGYAAIGYRLLAIGMGHCRSLEDGARAYSLVDPD